MSSIFEEKNKSENSFSNSNIRLITMDVVEADLTVCRSKIYQMIKDGHFPPPIKFGRSARWISTEVQEWIHDQAQARSAEDCE